MCHVEDGGEGVGEREGEREWGLNLYLLQYTSIEQAWLLGSHDKVVSLIFVVDNILQCYSQLFGHRIEKILTIDICHSTNLRYRRFLLGIMIHEIHRDCQSEFGTKFLRTKSR